MSGRRTSDLKVPGQVWESRFLPSFPLFPKGKPQFEKCLGERLEVPDILLPDIRVLLKLEVELPELKGDLTQHQGNNHTISLRKSKWGLSNGGLRPLSAICAQSSTIVHFCGPFGPLSKGSFRRQMTTIVGNRGQLWTSTLSPHLLSPHLDFPISQEQMEKSGLRQEAPTAQSGGQEDPIQGQILYTSPLLLKTPF